MLPLNECSDTVKVIAQQKQVNLEMKYIFPYVAQKYNKLVYVQIYFYLKIILKAVRICNLSGSPVRWHLL